MAPAARRFRPDVLVVSAGFDGHRSDPLAGMQLASSDYHWLCSQAALLASELCGGRCLFVLEGGYDLKSLGEAVCEAFRGVLGLPAETPTAGELRAARRMVGDEPMAKVEAAVEEAVRRHGLTG